MRSRYMIQSDPSAANLGLCNVKSLEIMVASGVVLGMQICFFYGFDKVRADLVIFGQGP